MVVSRSVESANPPVGYDTMSGEDQVRRWLASFRGAIADADYVDAFMDSGYDSLENMVFSSEDLMDSIEDMKQGHANRIARDAAAMLENIGNIVTVAEVSPAPIGPAPTGLNGVDSIKIAGAIPRPPTGDITRVAFGEWLGKVIPWLRLWSKELANAVVERRDNPALNQAGLLGKHAWDEGDNIILGSQLLASLGNEFKMHLTQSMQDASEGIDIMCTMMDRYYKVDDEYLLGLENRFKDQQPVQDIGQLRARLATWYSLRKELEDKGHPQSELTQKGSLLKVMSKITAFQACRDAVEVMQKGVPMPVSELLVLAEKLAARGEREGKSEPKNKNKNDKNDKKLTLPPPTNPDKPSIPPPPPIIPIAMVGGRSKRPCLAWGLKSLPECSHGDACAYNHDPAKYKNDHADTISVAKKIPCRFGSECERKGSCHFKHDVVMDK